MKATLKVNDKEIEVEITEEELKKFEEKKIRKRWRAVKGKKYWYAGRTGILFNANEDNEVGDDETYSTGNYFQTEGEAEFYWNELKYTQMLKDYIYEHDDVELDWNNPGQDKCFIAYDYYSEEKIGYHTIWGHKSQGAIYASNEQVLKDAVKFIGEENVKKYILKVEE